MTKKLLHSRWLGPLRFKSPLLYLKLFIQDMLGGSKHNSACEKVGLSFIGLQILYIIRSVRMFIIGPYEILAIRYDRF